MFEVYWICRLQFLSVFFSLTHKQTLTLIPVRAHEVKKKMSLGHGKVQVRALNARHEFICQTNNARARV